MSINKIMNKLLIIFIVFTVSAASFEGFFVKWSFREADPVPQWYAFEYMYEGTAIRPFVYRQLLISISKNISNNLSSDTKNSVVNKLKNDNFLANKFKIVDIKENLLLEYYLVYIISFLCLFVSVFIWRQICIDLTKSSIAGTLAPMIFTIIFPYLETNGGYFYDFSELLFFSMAIFFACRGHYIAIIVMTPIAAYNKESFLFFLMTLYPLLHQTQPIKKSVIVLGIAILISGLIHLNSVLKFENNGGDIVFYNVGTNALAIGLIFYFTYIIYFCRKLYIRKSLMFYILAPILLAYPFLIQYNAISYFYYNFGHTYSIISGEDLFFLHVIFVIWIIKSAWKHLEEPLKQHAKLALMINTPLIVLFGLVYELRNWSLLYPTFIILIAFYIKNLLDEAT